MKQISIALIATLLSASCSDSRPESVKGKPKAAYSGNQGVETGAEAGANTDANSTPDTKSDPIVTPDPKESEPVAEVAVEAKPAAPAQVLATDPLQILAGLKFEMTGPPKAESDSHGFKLSVKADPAITHFSYKIGNKEDCLVTGDYQVSPIDGVIDINVMNLPDGPVALCILKYYAPPKYWQKTEAASVIAWEKKPFIRTINSSYSEYDGTCKKDVVTTTVIKFNGNKSTYSWSRDPKSQGCHGQTKTSGEDILTVAQSDSTTIVGFWEYAGEADAGWYSFKWKDETRTSFTGTFG